MRSIASLPCKIVLGDLMRLFSKKSCYHQGFFAVKWRAVFILGAKWIALVRGWRSDCVVGGMETCFQCRKAHSCTAKCEVFHVAPRLFFMFLFLITFTILQQCIIYSQKFPNEPLLGVWGGKDFMDWAIFWICWGVVPQQPPTMLSRPSFAIALMWLAMKSGVS